MPDQIYPNPQSGAGPRESQSSGTPPPPPATPFETLPILVPALSGLRSPAKLKTAAALAAHTSAANSVLAPPAPPPSYSSCHSQTTRALNCSTRRAVRCPIPNLSAAPSPQSPAPAYPHWSAFPYTLPNVRPP